MGEGIKTRKADCSKSALSLEYSFGNILKIQFVHPYNIDNINLIGPSSLLLGP